MTTAQILTPSDFDKLIAEVKIHLSQEVEGIKGMMVEKPMCVKKTAEYLGISEATLHRWRRDGDLPDSLFHKINGSVYCFPSEVHAFIKKS